MADYMKVGKIVQASNPICLSCRLWHLQETFGTDNKKYWKCGRCNAMFDFIPMKKRV